MAQGNYDHPSYLTRQSIGLAITVAGSAGTTGGRAFISDMRFRKFIGVAKVAGTATTHAISICVVGTCVTGFATGLIGTALTTSTGTTTIGSILMGTTAAYATQTSTDMNFRLQAGSTIFLKNGTDVVGTADITGEAYLDPSATWTGPNG